MSTLVPTSFADNVSAAVRTVTGEVKTLLDLGFSPDQIAQATVMVVTVYNANILCMDTGVNPKAPDAGQLVPLNTRLVVRGHDNIQRWKAIAQTNLAATLTITLYK
ncbi:MAG: hypothetical protein H7Y11_11380 [Armatimonadetes bacterium]|nr:hypothetical protein [Anaerolineae bacterium]